LFVELAHAMAPCPVATFRRKAISISASRAPARS
jgi:hypothetical protein